MAWCRLRSNWRQGTSDGAHGSWSGSHLTHHAQTADVREPEPRPAVELPILRINAPAPRLARAKVNSHRRRSVRNLVSVLGPSKDAGPDCLVERLATTILRGGSAFGLGLWAVNFRMVRLSGQSSCPRGVNLFGMWRVQRLDQINAFNPANLFDFKSLALKFGRNRLAGLNSDPDGMRRVGMVSDTHARMICPIRIFPVHLSWKYAAKLGHPITSAGAP